MKAPEAPRLDPRRTNEFRTELLERARSWIPSWDLSDEQHDFGKALLDIAARFSAEVTERLDDAGDKMRRGFLDWLAVRGDAARPSRVPVVFKLTDSANDAVLADAPVRLQADAGGVPVVFETEKDVRVIPGGAGSVVAVDADADAFYLPAPGLSDLRPLEPLPVEWELKTFAAAGAKTLQVTPDTGLVTGMVVEAGGQQYEIDEVNGEIVKLTFPLVAELPPGTLLRKVTVFAPFEAGTHNQQEHALYIGHMDLLNLEQPATIDVVGLAGLGTPVKWQYWGKTAGVEEPGWQTLTLVGTSGGAVVLSKSAGAVDVKKVNGVSSRWIRAYAKTAEGDPFRIDSIELRINCLKTPLACPVAKNAVATIPAEAMANTTPLVIDKTFFPLGKEPRQFDAFYLGSQEAFSKKGADVQLCFSLADPSFSALTAVRTSPNPILAGVAADGHLHLFQFAPATASLTRLFNRVPLQPPTPAAAGAPAPGGGPPVALDPRPAFRVPLWSFFTYLLVAVPASGTVWIWAENTAAPDSSGWLPVGAVPATDPATPIDGLVFLADGAVGRLFALRDSRLFVRGLNSLTDPWEEVVTKAGANVVRLMKIAPISLETGDHGSGTLAAGLVGVSDDNKLYGIALSMATLQGACTKLLDDVATAVAPAAVRRASDLRLVAVAVDTQTPAHLVAFRSDPSTFGFDAKDDVSLDGQAVIAGMLDLNVSAGALTVVVSLEKASGSTVLGSWVPFAAAPLDELFTAEIPSTFGVAAGAPALLPLHLAVPTSTSQVIVAGFDLSRRIEVFESLRTAIIAVDAPDRFALNDELAIPTAVVAGVTKYELRIVAAAPIEVAGEALYEFNLEAIDKPFFVYRSAQAAQAAVDPADLGTLTITAGGPAPAQFDLIRIKTDLSTKLYEVLNFDANTGIADINPDLDVNNPAMPPATVEYIVPIRGDATIRPLLHLNPATTGNWQASILTRASLYFPNGSPEFQKSTAYKVDAGGKPELVVLGEHWQTHPPVVGGKVTFIVDGAVGEWSAQLGDTSTNPELSWEYWNGNGWWGLDVTFDATLHLKKTGAVRFVVPADMAPSDWAGKTNHWIRARLIGGDYGREKVTVTTKDLGNKKTEQTVERSTEGIRAPTVVKLHISYQVCVPVVPSFVLAQDSGSYRDQSDANRTSGAQVEAFVPVAVMLGRLSSTGVAAATSAAVLECPPKCECHGSAPAGTNAAGSASASAGVSSVQSAPRATGRAVFVGLTAPPSEAPVNALLLVDRERDYSALAPMAVEALVAEGFVPIVADDATRALGESGILSMAFAVPPSPREMFGRTLNWLQLRPRPVSGASAAGVTWSPTLRGAYLNAAWASATETMTRELLGSSDGAPGMSFTVARPPLLKDSLELRVLEPLGDEERADLQQQDNRLVLEIQELPGDWVLWKRVIDPGDEGPDARVYGLDETTGRITFGDGLHGMIPPIGRDSIVAFRYQRTETGADPSGAVPGNTTAPRTAFNLVSPVESVEAVVAADQAAGGAPPEPDDRVLRFGFAKIRHRRRVVTARDLEDLALQSSPDFAQARCLIRRSYARLIVVMRGNNPKPNASQVRELRRLLLEAAPAALAAPGALRIEGPAVRKLRVDLQLRIPALDQAGDVGRDVKTCVVRLFDTAQGGADGRGWPLGQSPTDGDIAYALMDVPGLESVADVALHESSSRRSDARWPASLKPNELTVLAEDPVRLGFVTAEVTA